jgi:hypothetical protein
MLVDDGIVKTFNMVVEEADQDAQTLLSQVWSDVMLGEETGIRYDCDCWIKGYWYGGEADMDIDSQFSGASIQWRILLTRLDFSGT